MTQSLTEKELKRLGIPLEYEPEVEEGKQHETDEQRFWDNFGKWISYWRANPHRFVSEYLQLKPFSWFQKILLFLMFKFNYFMWFASRGLGKSHLVGLYCVVRCILMPNTKICIASGVKGQALEIISKKIAEFKEKCPNLDMEIDEFKPNLQDALVSFHNGSWIKIVSATDNARGIRANVLNSWHL